MAQAYLKDDECETMKTELTLDKLVKITWINLKSLSNFCLDPVHGFK